MESRIKILACGYINIENCKLDNVQLRLLDTKYNKEYNVFCNLMNDDEDSYHITVNDNDNGDVDTCFMDSSGGIFMDVDFRYNMFDEELGQSILDLLLKYFIIEF